MSEDLAPAGLAEKIEKCGMGVVDASIGAMCKACHITPVTAGHVVLQQAMVALYLMGGVNAAHYAIACAKRLLAEDRGDRKDARKHAEAERKAFERMAAIFEAQIERIDAGGLQ